MRIEKRIDEGLIERPLRTTLARMGIAEQLANDLKQAMKDKDEVAKDTLRMLKAELMQKEVNLGRPTDEAEALAVLMSAVKTRTDAASEFDKGGRPELAKREHEQIAVIKRYLPEQLSEDEARAKLKALAAELGVTTKKDMGRLMKAVKEQYHGKIEGKLASKIAGEILS